MRKMAVSIILTGLMICVCLGATISEVPAKQTKPDIRGYESYMKVIADTVNMVSSSTACQLAEKYGLQILNVTWEDTGRYKGSSVGPNISDMTIQVQSRNPATGQYSLSCMPVIRFPNFSDKTCDVKMEQFFLLVGNEKGKLLKRVDLREYLGNFRQYLNKPNSWKGREQSLLAKRDTHVLVSAQACFLPIPKKGIAEFNPVLFNYQSHAGNPAVLAILATREGTSATIIDNTRDAFSAGRTWGQRLFFNKNGQRASLTGKRLSDFLDEKKAGNVKKQRNQRVQEKKEDTEGLNMVLLIQVPLKHKEMQFSMDAGCCDAVPPAPGCVAESKKSDVENAVIGHGKVEGPFTEIDNMPIERDERFPVRVTIQFYKATSNGVMDAVSAEQIAQQIDKVYSSADYVGSLVVDGETRRPTEYDGSKVQPKDWWKSFWVRYEKETGVSREEAMNMLKKLMGPAWKPYDEQELREKLDKVEGSGKIK